MSSLDEAFKALDARDFAGALAALDALAPAGEQERATVLFYRTWCRENLGDADALALASGYEQAAGLAQETMLCAHAWFRVGWLWVVSEEIGRAESALARATDLLSQAGARNSIFCHAAFWQAVCWERAGRFLDAGERYREVAEIDGSLRGECLYRQICCLVEAGALQQALAACEGALRWLDQDPQGRALELRRLVAHEQRTLHAALDAA